MNVTQISNLTQLSKYGVNSAATAKANRNETFENIFQAAVNMVKETNSLSSSAQEAEMAYSLGITNNTHDLQVAQQKANLSLQYTVAVRNQVLDAYREIMSMQF